MNRYRWFYLALPGGSPAAGPRVRHSPRTVVFGSPLLAVGAVAGEAMR